jgi:hypothetical protein
MLKHHDEINKILLSRFNRIKESHTETENME